MKYNLKNRPKFTDEQYPKTLVAAAIFAKDVVTWLEGFEAELRDIATKTRVIEGEPIISIKELLGEQ